MARRILEIGPRPIVRQGLPDETTFVYTGRDRVPITGERSFAFSPARIGLVRRLLMDETFDAIFVDRPSSVDGIFSLNGLSRHIFDRRIFRGDIGLFRRLGGDMAIFGHHAPLVVQDLEDVPFVDRASLRMWAHADLVFKRELPPDHWRLFMGVVHRSLPTPRFRRKRFYQSLIEKVRPISLGLPGVCEAALPPEGLPKKTDIFFAGAVDGWSTVRARGAAEIASLASEGYVIDTPRERLPRADYLRRCAEARLVWSPEGLGWDCYRHYEAAAAGSVPLINTPTILRYKPLMPDLHAVYYAPEPGGLAAAARQALASPERLVAMGREARAHVIAHHTQRAKAEYMLAELKALRERSRAQP